MLFVEFLSKAIVTPILIWIFKQVWIIKGLGEVTHFIVKLINKNNANSINYTIDSYIEESFSSLVSTTLGLFVGLIVIPVINKKIPLLCLSAFWLVLTILSNYVFVSMATEALGVPLKMDADRHYVFATSFILAGQILGTYIIWWIYSLYDFQNPFSKDNIVQ
jgi:uncharacterized protein YacL